MAVNVRTLTCSVLLRCRFVQQGLAPSIKLARLLEPQNAECIAVDCLKDSILYMSTPRLQTGFVPGSLQ